MSDHTLDLDALDAPKARLAQVLAERRAALPGTAYADFRLEFTRGKQALAECGKEKQLTEDVDLTLGVRVIAGHQARANGFWGASLGPGDLDRLPELLARGLGVAHERAVASAEQRAHLRTRMGALARNLADTELAPVEVCRDVVPATCAIDPSSISPAATLALARTTSAAVLGEDRAVQFNQVWLLTRKTRALFQSTEGADLDEAFALAQGLVFVVAGQNGEQQWDVLGDRAGWELFEGANVHGLTLEQFGRRLARETVQLSRAPELRVDPHREYPVITDPHYNALLVHEICGHPTEADRILKMETAYAGRSWFFRSFEENELDRAVASPLVNLYADPTLGGFGGYRYDAEGVRARRTHLIENGVLRDFQHSRETAFHLGKEPNGSMRAVNASYVPLVRMNNVVFGGGDTPLERMLAEVEDGFYIKGHRIPSISESRENFRITARLVYRIERGEIKELYRNGGLQADSKDFLMSIDAVGDDFVNYPVPFCGKGAPMQAMRVGNGGPHLRGRARLTGTSA